MKSFEWKNDFCTGIEEMDIHHKQFFIYLGELEKVSGGNRGGDVIEKGFKKVDNYIKYHFSEEEKLLKVAGYPEYVYQKKQHEFFISQIKNFAENYSKGDDAIPVSVFVFLRDWFLYHILESDKKYGLYLQEYKTKVESKA